MDFGPGTYALGLLAGGLSILSPCVLPIVPIVLGTASGEHRRGPLALAGGLALSFAIIGTAIAWAGSALDVDTSWFRSGGAILLGLIGVVLLSGSLQQRLAAATSGLGNAGQGVLARLPLDGLRGQFLIGLVLGVVWSPCVGPTLGAAVALASQGSNLPQVALLMGVFGVGAGAPLVALGALSRGAIVRIRGRLLQAGKAGKMVLGAAMLVLSVFILSGWDKVAETWMVEHSPEWLTRLTTRF